MPASILFYFVTSKRLFSLFDFVEHQIDVRRMKLYICAVNNAVDDRGDKTQAFDVVDEDGVAGWLRPSLRLQLEKGQLDVNPGDTVIADGFIAGSHWPNLAAESIQKLPVARFRV